MANDPLQTMFLIARKDLPNFPDEVFVLWLDDCIRRGGWPPKRGGEWDTSFCDLPVEYWREVSWKMVQVHVTRDVLTDRSQYIQFELDRILQGHRAAGGKEISDAPKRFEAARQYILTNQTVPGTLVLRDVGRFDILDGNHRVAAWFKLQESEDFSDSVPRTADAWIAYGQV